LGSNRAEIYYSNRYTSYGERYEYKVLIDAIPIELLDTIYIIRNPPVDFSIAESNDRSYDSDLAYQELRLITIKQSDPRSEPYLDLLKAVTVEMKEGDLFARNNPMIREVINPQHATNKMLISLNFKLQNLGYMSSYSHRFVPDIRAAMTEYQLDHNIPSGFLDEKTFKLLGLNFTELILPGNQINHDRYGLSDESRYNSYGVKRIKRR